MENSAKNHIDMLIFHTAYLCRSVTNKPLFDTRNHLREFLVRIPALRFGMENSMKNRIADALTRFKEYGVRAGKNITLPTILFVQKYGISPEKMITELTKIFGRKQYLYFRMGRNCGEKMQLDFLKLEIEKKAQFGESFEGVIVTELTGEEEPREREAIYSFLHRRSKNITALFTIRNEEESEGIKEELMQWFPFVIKETAECYSAAEQLGIFKKALKECGAELTEEAEALADERLRHIKWKETEHIENRIRNVANSIVYERITNGESVGRIPVSTVRNAFEELSASRGKGFCIGFAVAADESTGKVNKEYDKEMVA